MRPVNFKGVAAILDALICHGGFKTGAQRLLKLTILAAIVVLQSITADNVQIAARTVRRVVKSRRIFVRSHLDSAMCMRTDLEVVFRGLDPIVHALFVESPIIKDYVLVSAEAISAIGYPRRVERPVETRWIK